MRDRPSFNLQVIRFRLDDMMFRVFYLTYLPQRFSGENTGFRFHVNLMWFYGTLNSHQNEQDDDLILMLAHFDSEGSESHYRDYSERPSHIYIMSRLIFFRRGVLVEITY